MPSTAGFEITPDRGDNTFKASSCASRSSVTLQHILLQEVCDDWSEQVDEVADTQQISIANIVISIRGKLILHGIFVAIS